MVDGGDVVFALVYDDADTAAVDVEDDLRVSRGTVRADGSALNWYANVMGENVDVSGSDLEGFDDQPPGDEELLPLDRTIRGRITSGARFPADRDAESRPRFFGGATLFPEIAYEHDDVSDEDPIFHVQFTDGYTYDFERDFEAYPSSARYDIEAFGRRVDNLSVDGSDGGVEADLADADTIPRIEGSRTLAPEFEHRAHPYLGLLRAIAQRRAASLTRIANALDVRSVEEYVRDVNDQTTDAVAAVVQTVGPAPTAARPDNLAGTVLRKESPLAVAAGFGSTAGRAASGGLQFANVLDTAQSVNKAVAELEAWGDTIGDRPMQNIADACQAAPLQFDLRVHDPETNCEREAVTRQRKTTASALTALATVQYKRLTNALATADDFETQYQGYRATLEELRLQCELLDDSIGDQLGTGEPSFSADLREALRQARNYFSTTRTTIEGELRLLDALQEAFSTTEGLPDGYGDSVPIVDNSGDERSQNVLAYVRVVDGAGDPVAGERVGLSDRGGTPDDREASTHSSGWAIFIENTGPPPCNTQIVELLDRDASTGLGCNNGGVFEVTATVGDGVSFSAERIADQPPQELLDDPTERI